MQDFVKLLESKIAKTSDDILISEVGYVLSVSDGIVMACGMNKAMLGEMVSFASGAKGLVQNINENTIGIVVIGDDAKIKEGEEITCLKTSVSIPVGKELLGRVVDPLGNPLDGKGVIKTKQSSKVETMAPGIIERKSVHQPMQTGIKIIDALVAIGRGQRELIIGDRKTGKTTIAVDTIINQVKINQKAKNDSEKLFCVYVAIGQRTASISRIVAKLEEAGAMEYTTIVLASSSDPVSMQFLAPYSGCSIAEYFRDNGMHALIVYDDLSKHAVAYRQISLLLRRPPGREAYPGDVFYLHSRLLERAAKLCDERGGGSLTALPIIETQAGDVSAYIPTNVISITDGQIFLESELFYKGFRPAVNIGLSVSRIGSAAQIKAIKQVAGSLKLDLAQFRELESFSQFGSDLDDITKKTIERGKKISEILKQAPNSPLLVEEQIIILFAATRGFLNDIPLDKIKLFESRILDSFRSSHVNILQAIGDEKLTSELEKQITDALNNIKTTL
jgi:F-type H+-transporting ATPase subunit alpha